MQITGKTEFLQNPHAVWKSLTNPQILQACIPGCEGFAQIGTGLYAATAKIKAGPIVTRLAIEISITDIDPPGAVTPQSWSLEAVAKSPIGTATATSAISLAEQDGKSLLSYHCKAVLGGKLALFSGSWVDRAAKPAMEAFFERFRNVLPQEAEQKPDADTELEAETSAEAPSSPPLAQPAPAYDTASWKKAPLWIGLATAAALAAGIFLHRHHHKDAS